MVSELHNAAIITISKEALLSILQFEGGVIHDIKISDEQWFQQIEIVIEHPDLPEVRKGDWLLKITPTYSVKKRGNFIKMTRVDPQKLAKPRKVKTI
jgi:hypothetical protein